MADTIFTTGTVLKNQAFDFIVDSFLAAGWVNVSSNPTTDFVVLQSTGEAGDKTLTIQLRSTSATNINDTKTTDFNVISYRLVEGYTPGVSGASGTFTRPSETWIGLHLVPTAVTGTTAAATELTYFMHVDKNRMIVVFETPPSIALGAIVWYIGLPNVNWASEPGSRGLLVATSAYPRSAQTIHITNTPDKIASETASSTRLIYCELAPKNPNSEGLYAFSDMRYGNTAESWRGRLDGIYAIPLMNVNAGDILNVDSRKFRVVVAQTISTNNSFPTSAFVIQIA